MLKVNINGLDFKNPVIAASGTFGFGAEYNNFYDVGILGGISSKGLTLNEEQALEFVKILGIKIKQWYNQNVSKL